MAECGKGWTNRCAAAKSKKCRCRCGGENHGTARQKVEDDSPRRSSDEELYYAWDEKPVHKFLPSSEKIEKVRFTRIAGEPSPFGGEQRGKPIIELVYADHQERLQHRYVRHSPDGFEFGYGGSGPAETALNLLAAFVGVKNATEDGLYQAFKFPFISTISQEEGGEIEAGAIREFVIQAWELQAREAELRAEAHANPEE